MEDKMNFSVVSLGRTEIPQATEKTTTRNDYVPVGIMGEDDFFQVITEAVETSSTTSACVGGIADLIYGKGLYSKDATMQIVLDSIINQEDVKNISFDYKSYGNATVQIYWDNKHTKIIKMYHVPVQNIRAEKISTDPKIQNYYYCVDWSNDKAKRNKKKIPAFGTSNEKMEILYIKKYTPGKYYYSIPDWFSSLQFSYIEAELSNFHYNNINSGFLPVSMIQFNNGVPSPEERQKTRNDLENKFTGTKNAGKFLVNWNENPEAKATIDPINVPNISKQYDYVAEYAQDRILVSNRVTSPLLFGIRTAANGFSSNSEELKTAYSIMQTMVVNPFQNVILNALDRAFIDGGYSDMQLYFEQITPLVILNDTADATNTTVEQVQDNINDQAENPNVTQ